MKTAAAVLHELAVQLGRTPEYECISQSGPQHLATFEYRCTLLDESATAIAHSKKGAKQNVARALLKLLARAGHSVPPPWGLEGDVQMGGLAGQLGGMAVGHALSFVSLLKEYCKVYKLPPPDYLLIGDSGPPHRRSFTMRVTVGTHSSDATASKKKTARQMAAESIFKYLQGSSQDLVKVNAQERSSDKKMDPSKEERKDLPWRPPRSQKISEYHLGLVLQFNEQKRAAALEALRRTAEAGEPLYVQLECAAAELGLNVVWKGMPSKLKKPLVVVELPTTSPNLMFLGFDRNDAASHMVRYMTRALRNP